MTHQIDDKTATQATDAIKEMPQDPAVRRRIRADSADAVDRLSRRRPPRRGQMETLARDVLAQLGQPVDFLGFAMVTVNNAFWRRQFAAVPFSRRLLLLPHCLRRADECAGTYDSWGLECARCGRCAIGATVDRAEALGYHVLVAEGTPAVVKLILSGRADAVLGVACLDSLEKAFKRVVELGIPHMAVPLLVNGCVNTKVEIEEVRTLLGLSDAAPAERTRSYIPLLREARRILEPETLREVLGTEVPMEGLTASDVDPATGTEAIALDWLGTGGKRFRPFITLAAYAAHAMGPQALSSDADLSGVFPAEVRRVAVAIEALHKASLVHDDIEDDDAFRYGRDTLHRRFGVPAAMNVGDYLIGVGYRLVAEQKPSLGADGCADMLRMLSEAHVRLSRGQGAELLWREKDPARLRALDLLSIYALKTAPAFEAAMYVGLRAAGPVTSATEALMRRYNRYLGVAYQALNDLKDWRTDEHDKLVAGQDLLSMRPTILQAFAVEAAGDEAELGALFDAEAPREVVLSNLREVYETRGVFDRARKLVDKYRARARAVAADADPPAFRDLLEFIVDVVLQ